MQNKIVTILFFALFLISNGKAQDAEELYHLNLDAALGYEFHISDLKYDGLNKQQGIFSFRVMWEPEHSLRVGIESGYLQLYALDSKIYDSVFGSTDVFLTLHGIPIVIVTATEITENFEIIAGIGGLILISEVNSFDNNVRSTSWSSAYEFGASYLAKYSENLKLGAEVKSFLISSTNSYIISLQLSLKYNFYAY